MSTANSPSESGTVDIDIPCRKCQYNLRGLSTEGHCPECGSAVGLSLRGNLIRYSDPEWVEKLRLGLVCILWGVAMLIATVVLVLLFRQTGQLPGRVLGLCTFAVNFWGSWLLTTPDPSGLGEEDYGTSRKIIRFTLLAGGVQQLMFLVERNVALPRGGELAFLIFKSALSIVALVGTVTTIKFLGRLALRIPNHIIAEKARRIMWGIGLPQGLFVIITLITTIFGRLPRTPRGGAFGGLMVLGCFAGIAGLVMIIYSLRYLFLLWAMAKELKIQAAAAREGWASAIIPASSGAEEKPGGAQPSAD